MCVSCVGEISVCCVGSRHSFLLRIQPILYLPPSQCELKYVPFWQDNSPLVYWRRFLSETEFGVANGVFYKFIVTPIFWNVVSLILFVLQPSVFNSAWLDYSEVKKKKKLPTIVTLRFHPEAGSSPARCGGIKQASLSSLNLLSTTSIHLVKEISSPIAGDKEHSPISKSPSWIEEDTLMSLPRAPCYLSPHDWRLSAVLWMNPLFNLHNHINNTQTHGVGSVLLFGSEQFVHLADPKHHCH